MSAAVFWIDCPSANQAVSDFHSCPAPIAAGIRSEPSKRKVAAGSVSASADSLSIGSVYRLLSTPWLAETQPLAVFTRLLAQSELDR